MIYVYRFSVLKIIGVDVGKSKTRTGLMYRAKTVVQVYIENVYIIVKKFIQVERRNLEKVKAFRKTTTGVSGQRSKRAEREF